MNRTDNLLGKDKIILNAKPRDKWEAIRMAGDLLVKAGHVTPAYVEKMEGRERLATTYIGSGVAIPHGTLDSKGEIKSTGISVVQVPGGLDFGEGNTVYVLLGIAAVGSEHLDVLSHIAIVCSDEDNVRKAASAQTAEEIIALFGGGL
ncbi:PTS sugar transporter subunit IIA [Brevibacillus sp. TJ4]|uniref:PTS sugar transporter subunit IIA n=1 Tax=Brevibacillus sp. TJ4 TaxID=3234853 RepID=UPI0037CF0159